VWEYSLKTAIRQIHGNWNLGYVLDKHSISSVPIGEDAYGHMRFETIRTEVGEALYQLKYQRDWSQVDSLAGVLATALYPRFQNVGLVIPMVASAVRDRQPVTEIARALGKIVSLTCFDNLLLKSPNNKPLKNLTTKAEKVEALQGTLSVNEAAIRNKGKWNALLVDDLYDTGASLEAACTVLRGYAKIGKIYVAALTWR
jgi:predicted amidophosphoribosyltransferase